MYYGEIQAGSHSAAQTITMISSGLLDEFLSQTGTICDPTLGELWAYVYDCYPNEAGWSLSLRDLDGGAIPDGGYLESYLGPDIVPVAGATVTSSSGVAAFCSVTPSASNFFLIDAVSVDAGPCPPDTYALYTGRIYITGNAISELNLNLQN
jgi:hypothetical protein